MIIIYTVSWVVVGLLSGLLGLWVDGDQVTFKEFRRLSPICAVLGPVLTLMLLIFLALDSFPGKAVTSWFSELDQKIIFKGRRK
jgi:hypothetical protein